MIALDDPRVVTALEQLDADPTAIRKMDPAVITELRLAGYIYTANGPNGYFGHRKKK